MLSKIANNAIKTSENYSKIIAKDSFDFVTAGSILPELPKNISKFHEYVNPAEIIEYDKTRKFNAAAPKIDFYF